MSAMNTDDMDDLFKKAGEQYPLRTHNADWDAVSGKLDESNPSIFALPADSKKPSGKRKYLMLLALFALVLGGYYRFYKSGHVPDSIKQKQISSQKNIKENNPATSGFNNEEKTNSTVATDQKKSSLSNNHHDEAGPYKSDNYSKTTRNGSAHNEHTFPAESQMKEFHSPFGLDKPAINNNGEIGMPPLSGISKSKQTELKAGAGQQTETPIAVSKSHNSKFYAGIMIAPDISTVKFQSVKGVGYSIGVLAGYRISKKFSIETGAQLDIKNYYSEGEYFNKENIPNLDYSDLINIKGNCKMIEVPVNLRYNFHQSRKNDWFVTTGFSTYFMFRESYNYNYLSYGNPKAGYYATTKPSQYWFSVFNFSIGYEHQVGKIGSIRVEPYLKSPLTGMGTGSLPIMSTGVNLGIIHKF